MSNLTSIDRTSRLLRARLTLAAFTGSAALAWLSLAHAAPPAGATIGNQASATYTDDSQITRTVTSNTVVTIVQQVASLTLSANGTKTSNAGGQVAYPHTLTNTGNGNDTFGLTAVNTSGAFNFSSIQMYADANGDGVPDSSTPITTSGEVPAGGVFRFVAVGTVPNNAAAGNTNTMTVTAASVLTPATSGANTDVTTITVQGVINVTQALDVTYGPSPAGPRTITLTYTNTGNSTATNVTLADLIPSGMTYVAGSARWSNTGSTVLTDANSADSQSGIVYDYGVTVGGRVTAVVASVGPGLSGTVTFQVNVNGSLAPGATAATALTGTYAYNDGAVSVSARDTNTVQYTVAQTATVAVSSDTVANSAQGGTINFTNVVTNGGNGRDTFNMSTINQSFPAGTTLQLFRADGLTPLTDSNGDGLPDTGPINAGATSTIVVKATLPAGFSGASSYATLVQATSVFDPTKSANGTDTLSAVGANTVDLTSNSFGVGAPGLGAGPEITAVTTNTVAPGGTTRFTLVVSNGSTVADNFNLLGTTDGTFVANTLPAGWSVVFHDANGAVITNTGEIAAGGHVTVYADVTAPNSATTGFDVYFRARSPASGATDGLHNAVAVGTVRSLTLTPNNTGQAVSGGAIVYTHMIVNTGTATEGDGISTVALSTASNADFTSVVYWDRNNSGALEASDPIVTDLSQLTGGTNGASPAAGLLPGESARLFVKVTTAPGAANGVTDTTTLSATITGIIGGVAAPAAAVATDTTSVVTSHLALVKMQALDVTCDGTADAPYATGSLGGGAVPGSCIRYQITATNAGGAPILALLVNDATPANTTYHATVVAATTVGTVTAPVGGATGSVQATVGTLAPGQSAVLTFGVRIDQ